MFDFIGYLLNYGLYYMVYGLGLLVELISSTLFWAAKFGATKGYGFTDMPQIISAWIVVRDFSNMIFIIIMLLIAFGTILKLESYSYKKLLGRMIIMAILVNFSKTICGIAIDASQVFLFTFLNAMKEVETAGLLSSFGLDKLLSAAYDSPTDQEFSNLNIFFTLLVAGAMLAVSCVVTLTYMVMFLLRLAMLWLLVILSPLAYALNVLPATQSYAKEWWKKFVNYVVLGPMIGFFLWVALFVATYKNENGGVAENLGQGTDIVSTGTHSLTQAVTGPMLANFLIATLLLLGGLQMTTGLASEFSKVTGKVTSLGTAGMKFLGRRTDDVQNYARRAAGWGISKVGQGSQWAGQGIGIKREGLGRVLNTTARALNAAGRVTEWTGDKVGTNMTVNPFEIATAGKKIMDDWSKEKMGPRRDNLIGAMSNVLAPGRWAANIPKKLMGKGIAQEQDNGREVDEAMDAMTNNNWAKIQKGQKDLADGKINPVDFEKIVKDSLAHLEDEGARKEVIGLLQEKMDAFDGKSKDLDYSVSQRGRMEKTRDNLGGLQESLNNWDKIKDPSDPDSVMGSWEVSNFLTDQFGENQKKKNNFTSYKRGAKMGTFLGEEVAGTGNVLSWYAGEDTVDNDSMQERIAEASKKLERDSYNTEAMIHRMMQAKNRGDTATTIAAMRAVWKENDHNELHNNEEAMSFYRGKVKAHFSKTLEGDDLAEIMEDFENRYTAASYMTLFTEGMLKDLLKNNKAVGREDSRLGDISLDNAGGATYAAGRTDASTGQYIFNRPVAKKVKYQDKDGNEQEEWRAVPGSAQTGAFVGKLRNMSDVDIMKRLHPQTLVARSMEGVADGMTEFGLEFAKKLWKPSMAMQDKITRPDTKESISSSPKAQRDLIRAIKGASTKQERNRLINFTVTLMGMGTGAFVDKQAGGFAQNFEKYTDENEFKVDRIERLMEAANSGDKEVFKKLVADIGGVGVSKENL